MSKEQSLELRKWFQEQIAKTYEGAPDPLKIMLRITLMRDKDALMTQVINDTLDPIDS